MSIYYYTPDFLVKVSKEFEDCIYWINEQYSCPVAQQVKEYLVWDHPKKLSDLTNPIQFINLDMDSRKITFLTEKSCQSIIKSEGPNFNYPICWSHKSRTTMKIGKFIKYAFGVEDNTKLESFASHVNEYINRIVDADFRFEIVEGEDIRTYYNIENYTNLAEGELHSSCMANEECYYYFDLYVYNPHTIKLAVLFDDEGLVAARSLVWYKNRKMYYYDRIYFSTQQSRDYMKKCLEEKGLTPIYQESLSITLPINNGLSFNCYPYLDSLPYITQNTISSVQPNDTKYYYLRGTGGDDYEIFNETHCEYCNTPINESEFIVYSDYGNAYCIDCSAYNDITNEYIPLEYATYIENRETYVNSDEAYESAINGSIFYYADDCVYSEYHSGWILADDSEPLVCNEDYIIVSEADEDIAWSKYHNGYVLAENCHSKEEFGDYITLDTPENKLEAIRNIRHPSKYQLGFVYN